MVARYTTDMKMFFIGCTSIKRSLNEKYLQTLADAQAKHNAFGKISLIPKEQYVLDNGKTMTSESLTQEQKDIVLRLCNAFNAEPNNASLTRCSCAWLRFGTRNFTLVLSIVRGSFHQKPPSLSTMRGLL